MAIIYNGTGIPENGDNLYYRGTNIDKVVYNGTSVWNKQKYYYIVFNGNGATSGSMASQTMPVGIAAALSPNAYQKMDFYFSGWASSASGNAAYANSQAVKDIAAAGATTHLFAKWRANDKIIWSTEQEFQSPTTPWEGNIAIGTLVTLCTGLDCAAYRGAEITFGNSYGYTSHRGTGGTVYAAGGGTETYMFSYGKGWGEGDENTSDGGVLGLRTVLFTQTSGVTDLSVVLKPSWNGTYCGYGRASVKVQSIKLLGR